MAHTTLNLSPNFIGCDPNLYSLNCRITEVWARGYRKEITLNFHTPIPILQLQTTEQLYPLTIPCTPRGLRIRTEGTNIRTGEPLEFAIHLEVPWAPFPQEWLRPFKNELLPTCHIHHIHAIRTARGNVRTYVEIEGAPSLFYHLGTILAV